MLYKYVNKVLFFCNLKRKTTIMLYISISFDSSSPILLILLYGKMADLQMEFLVNLTEHLHNNLKMIIKEPKNNYSFINP